MTRRVAGCDPGTSSLDVCVLADGAIADQARFPADALRTDPAAPVAWLRERGPFACVAAPSGYGMPLTRAADATDRDFALMTLARPDDADGVSGFGRLIRAFAAAVDLPAVFLPGVIHLPTVPPHRKANRIDLGTADKLCVAALAAAACMAGSCGVIELGSAFTALLVLVDGQVVDAAAGTAGPLGGQSGGAWDGEVAYLFDGLLKGDLFRGGLADLPPAWGREALRESVVKAVAGLNAVTPVGRWFVSGRLADDLPDIAAALRAEPLPGLPGAWVKHAAQGAAVIADGLAGGDPALVERLAIRRAAGTVLDHIHHPRFRGYRF